MSITIAARLTYDRLPEIIAQFPELADEVCGKTAHDIAADAQTRVPVDLGNLKNSIKANRQGVAAWTVDVTADYGAAVEYGSAPHMPPVAALQGWADKHGIDPWALAIAIKRHGTRKQPYLTPAAEAHRAAFTAAMSHLEAMLA